MELKQILDNFFTEKEVSPPLTIEKIQRAGHNVSAFLLELKQKVLKAKDIQGLSESQKKHFDSFLLACEDLMSDK